MHRLHLALIVLCCASLWNRLFVVGIWLLSLVQLFASLWGAVSQGLQHTRSSCCSPSPGVCPSSCPLNGWCYLTMSSPATLFSFWLSYTQNLWGWKNNCYWLKKGCTIWELPAKFYLGQDEACSLGDNTSDSSENLLQTGSGGRSVQSLSHVQHFATPWTASRQASLSITNAHVCDIGKGKFMLSSTCLIKGFLLVTRSRCHQEGI